MTKKDQQFESAKEEKTTVKRKRGRPPKVLVNTSIGQEVVNVIKKGIIKEKKDFVARHITLEIKECKISATEVKQMIEEKFRFLGVQQYFIRKYDKDKKAKIYLGLDQKINTSLKGVKELLETTPDQGNMQFEEALNGTTKIIEFITKHTKDIKYLREYLKEVRISKELSLKIARFYCELIFNEE